MHSRTRNRTRISPLGPGRDLHFTIRERKERELNPQGSCKNARPASNRFPSPFGLPFRNSFNTSTRIRTQNTPLEAEHDFHFTTEAKNKRKARDSNPHGPKTARFSKPARQALSGYLPYSAQVRPGIEPDLRPYQGRVLPQHLQTVVFN